MAPQKILGKNNASSGNEVLEEKIRNVLDTFHDPVSGETLMKTGRVEGITFQDQKLCFALRIPPEHLEAWEKISREIEATLLGNPEIRDVLIVLTAEKSCAPSNRTGAQERKVIEKWCFPSIRHIIAVASGKGGVGKSTVSVNLAVALQSLGFRVGIFDADFYGPSIPHMLGLVGQPELTEEKKMIPPIAYGVKCMSIGFLVDEKTPIIWRGPILQSSFQQLMEKTEWGQLDVLVIDMPPGTGDTHLTLVQRIPLAGAVVVSTPQDIALLDARRAISMFRKMETPVLGIVENMSIFVCPHCHHETDIFNAGGAEAESARQKIPFLGAIPLQADIRSSGDSGQPASLDNKGKTGRIFVEIAGKVAKTLGI